MVKISSLLPCDVSVSKYPLTFRKIVVPSTNMPQVSNVQEKAISVRTSSLFEKSAGNKPSVYQNDMRFRCLSL